jgi:hypothetical protein
MLGCGEDPLVKDCSVDVMGGGSDLVLFIMEGTEKSN